MRWDNQVHKNCMEGTGGTRDELGQPGSPQKLYGRCWWYQGMSWGNPGGPENCMEAAGGTRDELGYQGGPQKPYGRCWWHQG